MGQTNSKENSSQKYNYNQKKPVIIEAFDDCYKQSKKQELKKYKKPEKIINQQIYKSK
tara:strand:+ start:579 stop:752 length:174 start_codon:yes stop_codon:yes gene_type:complete